MTIEVYCVKYQKLSKYIGGCYNLDRHQQKAFENFNCENETLSGREILYCETATILDETTEEKEIIINKCKPLDDSAASNILQMIIFIFIIIFFTIIASC